MVKRVAIVGGGMAGLACAWALSETPELRRRIQVTLYESSWFLGGKGASVRGPNSRIEEHGLHVVMGHYREVLALMRGCYAELGRAPDAPLSRFEQAFVPLENIVMGSEDPGNRGAWQFWDCHFPARAPGRPAVGSLPLRALQTAAAMLGEAVPERGRLAARRLAQRLAAGRGDPRSELLREFLGVLIRGIHRDRLVVRGFDAVEHEDLREWFARHGASAPLLASPLLRVMYDVLFARLDGDPNRESLAAGTALRFGLRMLLDYDGGFFWLMQAGMGEVVFAPLYEVLLRRGVRFRFFHRLESLALTETSGATRVESLSLRRLATPRGAYEPLEDVAGLPTWRATPDCEQLREGPELVGQPPSFGRMAFDWPGRNTVRLCHGQEFDEVVLAIPPAALEPVFRPHLPRQPHLAAMLAAVPTNGTLACQLWFRRGLNELGRGPVPAAVTSFADPMATVADMSHLLARENHPREVRGLLYLTSSLPPELESSGQEADLRDACRTWLERHGPALLPGAVDGQGRFDWSVLHDPEERIGPARLNAQYMRINHEGSERYTLSPPGCGSARLDSDGSRIENVLLAGDWTDNSLSCGCLEAATDSGLRAARAALRRTSSRRSKKRGTSPHGRSPAPREDRT